MEMFTVIHDMLTLCVAIPAMGVLALVAARAEYYGSCTVNGNDIKPLPVHCRH